MMHLLYVLVQERTLVYDELVIPQELDTVVPTVGALSKAQRQKDRAFGHYRWPDVAHVDKRVCGDSHITRPERKTSWWQWRTWALQGLFHRQMIRSQHPCGRKSPAQFRPVSQCHTGTRQCPRHVLGYATA